MMRDVKEKLYLTSNNNEYLKGIFIYHFQFFLNKQPFPTTGGTSTKLAIGLSTQSPLTWKVPPSIQTNVFFTLSHFRILLC